MTPQYKFAIYKAENGWVVEGGAEGKRNSVSITSDGVTVGNLIDAAIVAERIDPEGSKVKRKVVTGTTAADFEQAIRDLSSF